MRILHMFFIGMAIAALYGCNSSSTGNTESNTAGSRDDTVSENTTSGQAEQYTGPLGTIVSLTDVAVHGTVKSMETVYSSDAGEIPHTVANGVFQVSCRLELKFMPPCSSLFQG